jgi:hypothetical protein
MNILQESRLYEPRPVVGNTEDNLDALYSNHKPTPSKQQAETRFDESDWIG